MVHRMQVAILSYQKCESSLFIKLISGHLTCIIPRYKQHISVRRDVLKRLF